ncbi:MAG: OsmC family protein [Planctomycetaceae bacterium]|nr:OsmC family protein [Planctomycetaceae bacterium]
MNDTAKNSLPQADATIDGGDLDCGSGLLLMIRNAMTPIPAGGVLEIRSREISVKEDLPAWCRMVGHTLVSESPAPNKYTHYFVRKKQDADSALSVDLQQAKDYVWRARIKWQQGMVSKVFARNHAFEVGQPASFNTEDEVPGAIEHLLGALGGDLSAGFQWRLSRAGIEVYNLEISLSARVGNVLVFLGIEDDGNPGIETIDGKVYVDADSDKGASNDEIERIWQDTLRRSPLAQTLAPHVKLNIDLKRVP